MSLKVKKTKDPLRSWTVKFNKKIYFYNSTGIQYQFLIEVEKNNYITKSLAMAILVS